MRLSSATRAFAWVASAVIPVAMVAGPLSGVANATRPPAPQKPTILGPTQPFSNDRTPSFTWLAQSGANYVCTLDSVRVNCAVDPSNTGWWKYGVPASAPLKDGSHTFAVRTKVTGHRPITTPYSWTLDTVPPAPPSIVAPPASTRATSVAVSFTNGTDADFSRNTCTLTGTNLKPAVTDPCTSPFTASGLTSPGNYNLVVAAYDDAGNSATSTVSWAVNPNAPDVPVVVGPTSPTNSSSASINFSTVNQATYKCALDSNQMSQASGCTSPTSVSGLADGYHFFTVWATDTAGNTYSNYAAWTVDTTPPHAPHLQAGPAAVTDDFTPTIRFWDDFDLTGVRHACTVTDTTAGVVVVGADKPVACSSPWDFDLDPTTPNGHHFTAHIVPTDGAGNVGPALDVSWVLDQSVSPSPIVWLAGPDSPSNVQQPTFTFNAPDAGQSGGATGFLCALDADPTQSASYSACGAPDGTTGDGSYTVGSPLGNGLHTFAVETTNGTTTSSPMVWYWLVDATAPPVPVVNAPDPSTPNPTITFSDGDPTVTFLCSIDGGPFVPCASPWTPPAGLSNGTHTLVVEARDQAGNTSKSGPIRFTVQSPSVAAGSGPTVSSFTLPTTLTGSIAVGFDRKVTGLATNGVVYGVNGTKTILPARVACLSASVRVSCSSTFTAVRLTPATPLVPGQSYIVVAMAGATHDASGNASAAASKVFRAARVVEENSVAVQTPWPTARSKAALGGSYVREHLRGATASWSFVGTSITWWTVTGPTQGDAAVYVDGVKKATFHNYAAATHLKVARVVKGLKKGAHTIRIQVLGTKSANSRGTFVAVDGFTVGKTVTKTPAVTTTVRRVSGSHFLAGHAAVADITGQVVTLTFRGTAITWTTVRGANQGQAAIYVDGVRKATVDNYAGKTAYGVKRTVSHLSNKVHTVKIVVLGKHHSGATGNLVTIDRFTIA